MNFHYELHRRPTRRALARCGCRQLHILDVRAHELTAARAPEWEACRIRYYPAYADTSQVLPGNGLLNGKEPLQ